MYARAAAGLFYIIPCTPTLKLGTCLITLIFIKDDCSIKSELVLFKNTNTNTLAESKIRYATNSSDYFCR